MQKYRNYIRSSIFGSYYDKTDFPNHEANKKRLEFLTGSRWSVSWDRELAKLLRISPTQMSRIINCYSKLSLETIIKLAWLCNTTVDHILKLEKDLGMIDASLDRFIK